MQANGYYYYEYEENPFLRILILHTQRFKVNILVNFEKCIVCTGVSKYFSNLNQSFVLFYHSS